MSSLTDVHGHVMVVTGAAGGIGAEICRHLSTLGATVVAADRDLVRLHEVHAGDSSMHFRQVDFLDDSSIIELIAATEADIGPIKGVVNCVGVLGKSGMLSQDVDLTDFDLVYQINLRAALVLSMEALRVMTPRRYGRILQLASISGKEGNPGLLAYSVTKAGLIAMVKTQGKEYADSGITVNALAPALIDTALVENFTAEQRRDLASKIPMKRLGSPTEVAALATWILSPACSFTTGFAFDLSGGRATY
jgi:2-dehydro-3-deoxy-L-rhamnonate dehydrogenase (NAD+)